MFDPGMITEEKPRSMCQMVWGMIWLPPNELFSLPHLDSIETDQDLGA